MNMKFDDNCIFCKIIKRQIPAKIVFEDDQTIAFEDITPQAPTHILIIPKIHIENFSKITEADKEYLVKLLFSAKKIAKEKKVEQSGFRLVINSNKDAGQDVYHLHLHLLGGRKFHWPPG